MSLQKFKIVSATSRIISGQAAKFRFEIVTQGEPALGNGIALTLTYELSGDSAVFSNGKKTEVHAGQRVFKTSETVLDSITVFKSISDSNITNVTVTADIRSGAALQDRHSLTVSIF